MNSVRNKTATEELLALKKRIANDEAARKVREAAAKNKAYRASFNKEEHEKFIQDRPYLVVLGVNSDIED